MLNSLSNYLCKCCVKGLISEADISPKIKKC